MQRTFSHSALLCMLGILLIANPFSVSAALAKDISKANIEAVSNATFEVVVLKPTVDTLSYERPLPLDLIPFTIRNDLYYSVGTAFAINANQWVTAAHVFDLGDKSLSKAYRLRDRFGKVYDIDKILKYSMRRDFVVFTVKNPPSVKPLGTNTVPRVNDKVYAVGNALGNGVVFRDGLYTSTTPEEQDGEWKWIRFSAAASPGNSGGPLLDLQGRVIGVVMRKSENENLNYALPINEILTAQDRVADVDARGLYKIDNMPNLSSTDRIRKKITLPKSYAELDAQLTADLYDFGLKLQNDFFTQQHEHVFPSGKESLPLLHTNYDSVMPGFVARGENGIWDVFTPRNTSTNDIGVNGSLTYGTLGSTELILFQKPDGIETSVLYKDSKLMMDYILQGDPLYRQIENENIKITSMGKAIEESTHTDRYGRKWLVRQWDIDYSDRQVALFVLPVPGGFAGMLRMVPTGQMAANVDDLKVLADFSSISYYGTLLEWRDLLAQRDLLPQAFTDIKIDFAPGKDFHYTSKRLTFSYGHDEMRVTEKSDLKLNFSYFLENGKAVWDVTQVVAGDGKDSATFFAVARHLQPAKQLDDKFKSAWNKIAERQYPYNKSAFFDNKRTLIGDIYAHGTATEHLMQAPFLYTTFYGTSGNLEQKSVQMKLDRFMEKLTVIEN
jgi:serine protease Do